MYMNTIQVPSRVLEEISLTKNVIKDKEFVYTLTPTGIPDLYEILKYDNNKAYYKTEYLSYLNIYDNTFNYYLANGRIITGDEIFEQIKKLKELLTDDLLALGKTLEPIDWEKTKQLALSSNEIEDTEQNKARRNLFIFDNIKNKFVRDETTNVIDTLNQYIENEFIAPGYNSKDYVAVILEIVLKLLINPKLSEQALNDLYELNTLRYDYKRSKEIDKVAINNEKAMHANELNIIVDFYKNFANQYEPQRQLYQFLRKNNVKNVNIILANDKKEHKLPVEQVYRLLNGYTVWESETNFDFKLDDVASISYRKKEIYQKN